jgi:hypothetical protein
MLVTAASASARLPAPHPQYPRGGATVQALPAFTWGNVRGAATYQFEISADAKFSSAVNGFAEGPISLDDTAITDDRTIPNGTYYWRVRAVTASDRLGYWSRTQVLNKNWRITPTLVSPINGAGVNWPTQPLELRWNPVSYATSYNLYIATDPALSNLVTGPLGAPPSVQGSVATPNGALPPGTYYWAVTPVDAEGNTGPRSAVQSFTWNWPSSTSTSVSNAATVSTLMEPDLSWGSVPGAASYQIQVNTSPEFPAGSEVGDCCDTALGTSLIPTSTLPNASNLYWRVRGIDLRGDAGSWNNGPPFAQSFDQQTPAVTGLQVLNTSGNGLPQPNPPTNAPIVSWNPVPGASSYVVQIIHYNPSAPGGVACSPSSPGTGTIRVASTYWTPAGSGGGNLNQTSWPGSEGGLVPTAGSYCVGVAARRDDGNIQTDFTYLGGPNNPAFNYTPPAPQTGTLQSTPASAYILPATAGNVPTEPEAPLFTWNPVPGANGYYVIVASDANFTHVVANGFVNSTAFASRNPLPDETSAYYWAVIPTADAAGDVFNPLEIGVPADNPQAFNKSSIPPSPLTPVGGQTAGTYPTFQWAPAEGEQNYTIQIAGDPSFANPLEQHNTDATSYTAETTLPADRTLFWRVRANDEASDGLNWSPTETFTHSLPVPAPLSGNPTGGTSIPAFTWTTVPGAVSYNMHVDQADGTKRDFNVDSPILAPTFWWGTGIWRWQVQAVFPGGVTGAYFSPEEQYVRVEPPPSRVVATKSGPRIIISWQPDSNAKQYSVQLSTTEGFGGTVATDTTDNTSWVPQINATVAAHTLFWRVAAVDQGGNVGAYASGVFHAARKKPVACQRSKKKPHRCIKKKTKKKRKKK